MKNKAIDARTYQFGSAEPILIDTNVWLYLQPPAMRPTSRGAAGYSSAFSNLLRAKAQPVVDALILSEYLNRYIRIEYDASWRSAYTDFKEFRKSADSTSILQAAVAEIDQILKTAKACNTQLNGINMAAVLGEVQAGTIDFNDSLLIENCRLNGWKLLTHDSDMTTGGIDVLTTNTRLLQACQ